MKKNKILIVFIITLLSSVLIISSLSFFGQFDRFSFNELNINLNDTGYLGIGRNISNSLNRNSKRYAASFENERAKFDSLIRQNDDGSIEVVDFFNVAGEEVAIPYHLIHLEPYGQFIYLAYSNWPKEYILDQNAKRGFSDMFFYAYQTMSNPKFNMEFAAIEKNTGKVFDLKESILNEHSSPTTNIPNSDYLGSPLVYLPDGFAFIDYPNPQNGQMCINRAFFDVDKLDINKVCSTVLGGFYGFENIYALPNGDIRLANFNNFGPRIINLYTLEITSISDLQPNHPAIMHYDFENHGTTVEVRPYYLSANELRSFRISNNNVESIITKFEGENLVIETIQNLDGFKFNSKIDSLSKFYLQDFYFIDINYGIIELNQEAAPFNKFNLEDFTLTTIIPDIKTLLPENFKLKNLSNLDYFINDNKLYLFTYVNGEGNFPILGVIDLITLEFETLVSANGSILLGGFTEDPNNNLLLNQSFEYDGIMNFSLTGNYKYSLVQSLTEQTYIFNIFNRTRYLEGESIPFFTNYSILPIN
jgi:hypothetical protein